MRIAVLGAGAWGTALAAAAAARHHVWLWARDADQAEALQRLRCNARYLPDVSLPAALQVGTDLAAACAFARGGLLIIATPMAGLRPMLQALPAEQPAPPIKSIIVGTIIIGLAMLINVAPLYMAGGVTARLWLPMGSLFVVMTVALIAFGELFASSRLYSCRSAPWRPRAGGLLPGLCQPAHGHRQPHRRTPPAPGSSPLAGATD